MLLVVLELLQRALHLVGCYPLLQLLKVVKLFAIAYDLNPRPRAPIIFQRDAKQLFIILLLDSLPSPTVCFSLTYWGGLFINDVIFLMERLLHLASITLGYLLAVHYYRLVILDGRALRLLVLLLFSL
jgi:hypothetical protein